MKKTFFLMTAICILVTSISNAQIQKGNILVGGDIANFELGLRKGSPFTMRVDPKLAFFIHDNVAVGGYIDLGLTSITGTTFVDYGVGILGRYYFPDKNNINPIRHSRLFAEANVGFTGQDVSRGGNNTNGLGIGFGPGYAYFITSNIGLETLLKYNGIVGFGNTTTQSDLNLSVGFQIYLPTSRIRSKIESDVR